MSSEPYIVRPGVVRGRLTPPPSKSQTQRFLNLALLSDGPVRIFSPLISEDTLHFAEGLRAAGWNVQGTEEAWELMPPEVAPAGATIDCGASGTMLRFLTAGLTSRRGEWELRGDPRLAERPIGPLIRSLRDLGAEVEAAPAASVPLRIHGRTLGGGASRVDAGESSQYLSALLMAAPRARESVTLHVEALTSAPYVELTLDSMARFGVDLKADAEGTFHISPAAYQPVDVRIEADTSSACYFAAAAALTGGEVEIVGLRRETRQGDAAFFDLLERMGAEIRWGRAGTHVRGTGSLQAVDADLSNMPDQVPTLAALAPFCSGTTRIHGVAHLRLKESDRLSAMAREIRRLGAVLEEDEGGLDIEGDWSAKEPPDTPVRVDTHNDHRIAMSLALVGLRRAGVSIDRPQVVAKSYPGFWTQLENLLA